MGIQEPRWLSHPGCAQRSASSNAIETSKEKDAQFLAELEAGMKAGRVSSVTPRPTLKA